MANHFKYGNDRNIFCGNKIPLATVWRLQGRVGWRGVEQGWMCGDQEPTGGKVGHRGLI